MSNINKYIFEENGKKYFNAYKLNPEQFFGIQNKKVEIQDGVSGTELRSVKLKENIKNEHNYFLIESREQIEYKLKSSTGNKINFSRCIFLTEVNFSKINFERDVDFSNAQFVEKTSFGEVNFQGKVNFSWVNFIKKISFYNVGFIKDARFSNAWFNGDVSFSTIRFKGRAYFFRTKFIKVVNFHMVRFVTLATFREARFKMKTCFFRIKFMKVANFSNLFLIPKRIINISFVDSTFDRAFIFSVMKVKNINRKKTESKPNSLKLILSRCILDSTKFFIDVNILQYLHKETVHTTYNYFKDASLTRHNTISALEFHKKEYDAYLHELKENKPWYDTDKLLLSIEKHVSYFGTKPFRAILWWFIVLGIFAEIVILILISYSNTNLNDVVLFAIQPLSIFQNYESIFSKLNMSVAVIIYILNFVKTILLAFLTYEITKSFRKFSRKF